MSEYEVVFDEEKKCRVWKGAGRFLGTEEEIADTAKELGVPVYAVVSRRWYVFAPPTTDIDKLWKETSDAVSSADQAEKAVIEFAKTMQADPNFDSRWALDVKLQTESKAVKAVNAKLHELMQACLDDIGSEGRRLLLVLLTPQNSQCASSSESAKAT
jgi:hypothetical protein